jgi:hypothetical protein
MAYEPKEGRGTMFKNTRKTTDKHPEYRGDFKGLDGVTYDIAFWWAKDGVGAVKKDKDGHPMMSLKIEHKRQRDDAPAQEQPGAGPDLGDEIPFAPQVD